MLPRRPHTLLSDCSEALLRTASLGPVRTRGVDRRQPQRAQQASLSLRVAGYDTDAVATLIFDNGLERARPQGVGEHAVMLSALDAGFHELVRVVVNSSWVERGTDAWQCYLFFRGTREGLCAGTFLQCVQAQQTFRASVRVEQWAPAGPADESECVGILAYEYDKVNLFEHTLLAPALDPSSALFAHETRQEGGKAYQQRPVPYELANR